MKQPQLALLALFLTVLSPEIPNAQLPGDGDCKAIMNDEIVSYEGDCKRGFAHGKGKTEGDEYYEGEFKKGRPHGYGIFFWANGNRFEGYWEKGVKEGEGTLTMVRLNAPDSVLTGYWEKDKYVGEEKQGPAYKILRNMQVRRYRFQKINDIENAVEIRITRGAQRWSGYQTFVMQGTPGVEYNTSNQMGYKEITYPFQGSVSMTVPNQFNTSSYAVFFEYKINEPGRWIITLEV